jgi:hypothetical protein
LAIIWFCVSSAGLYHLFYIWFNFFPLLSIPSLFFIFLRFLCLANRTILQVDTPCDFDTDISVDNVTVNAIVNLVNTNSTLSVSESFLITTGGIIAGTGIHLFPISSLSPFFFFCWDFKNYLKISNKTIL